MGQLFCCLLIKNKNMDKNKLVLPISIIIGCIILGGFFYASQANKQASIERQQQLDLRVKQAEQQAITDQNNMVASEKADCVTEAQLNAIALNKASCDRGDYCLKGDNMYLVAQYENSYNTCLQRKGLK
jgi:hypothetical protein